jgi:hypothetical protein
MVVGVGYKNFGSRLIVGGLGVFSPRKFFYFSTPMTAIPGIYSILHYGVDRLNLQ